MKRIARSIAYLFFAALTPIALQAVDGTWTNLGGGSWATSVNWEGGLVADGADGVADFSTLDLTSDATVTLDGARTIGTLKFSDTAASHLWQLNTGSADPLTLQTSSGTPVIDVAPGTSTAVVNAVLAGTNGFTKTGAGSLLLTGANNITGTIINGTTGDSKLAFTTPAAFNGQKIQLGVGLSSPQSRFIASGADLAITNVIQIDTVRTIIGNNVVNGLAAGNQTWSGTIILNHGNNNVHDLYAQKLLTIGGTITEATPGLELRIGNGNTTITGTNHTYTGATVLDAGTTQLNGPDGGNNTLAATTVRMQNNGRLSLLANEQIPDSVVLQFGSGANNGRFQPNGFNETVAGIDDQAASGNRIVEAAPDNSVNKPSTLILDVPDATTYTHRSYLRDAAGASASNSALTIIKRGSGTQVFGGSGGIVSYTGGTTVEAGILQTTGGGSVLANCPVTLAGGTLLLSPSSQGTRTQPITGNGTLHKANSGNLVIDTGVTNNFSGTTIHDAAVFQVKAGAEHSGNDVVVNGGSMEILGEMHAASVTVNGGNLISGNLSTFTSLITGPVTNLAGRVRGWATLSDVLITGGDILPGNTGTASTLTISNLTCAGGTLLFDVAGFVGGDDVIAVDTLSVTAPTVINGSLYNSGFLSGNRAIVMTYNTLTGGLPALTNLQLAAEFAGTREQPTIDTGTPGEIAILFNNPFPTEAPPLTWVGGAGGNAWDIGTTTNWQDSVSAPTPFYNGEGAIFDSVGVANQPVNVGATVYPSSMTVTGDYTFAGAGSIIAGTLTNLEQQSSLTLTGGVQLSFDAGGGSWNTRNDTSIKVIGSGTRMTLPSVTTHIANGAADYSNSVVVLADGGEMVARSQFVLPNSLNGHNNGMLITNGGRFTWDPAVQANNFLFAWQTGCYDNYLTVEGANSIFDLGGRGLYVRQGTNNSVIFNGALATNIDNIHYGLEGQADLGLGLSVLVTNSARVYATGTIGFGTNDNLLASTFTLTGSGSVVEAGNLNLTRSSGSFNHQGGTLKLGGATVDNGSAFTVGDGAQSATLELGSGSYSFANDLNVSANATLKGSGTVSSGNVNVSGSFQPGASVGALTMNNNLSLSGTALMEIDKAGGTNDSATVLGTLTYGGTLTVTNLGGTLAAGDSFKLFNFAGTPGSFSGVTLPPLGGGLAWTNLLAEDGSIQVINTSAPAPTLVYTNVGPNVLQFSWAGAYKLIWQTNALNVGLRTNWVDFPGGGTSPVNVTNDRTIPTAFFGLRPQP